MSELVFTLPAEAAASVDPEGVEGAITDHADRAVARLAEQYQKPKIQAFLRALIHPVQALENVAWQVYTERSVDNAVGAQLDILGRIVGQPRDGYADADYRRFIRARITVNRSDGVVEDLLLITRLIVDDEDAVVVAEPQYPGAIVIRVEGAAVSEAVADVCLVFLQEAASAGVRVMFEYSTVDPSLAFSFAGGPGLGFGAGAFTSVGG